MSGGFPERSGRVEYGKSMRDERKVADPSRELGADVMNLLFWNLGAAGLCAPKAVMLFRPSDSTLVYGVFSWLPTIYENVVAPFPSFTYAAVAGGEAGQDMQFTFASPVVGMGGASVELDFAYGAAQVVGIPGTALPSTRRRATVFMDTSRVFRVAVNGQGTDDELRPCIIVLW